MRPEIKEAILRMYQTIAEAALAQSKLGHVDQGQRRGITAGRHLLPLADLIKQDLLAGGFAGAQIFTHGSGCRLPGWFRAAKEWDLTAFSQNRLLCAVELKSISSSFSNNLNNRVEEAVGCALDLKLASKELYAEQQPPALGYVMIAKDCEESRKTGAANAPAYLKQDPAFFEADYLQRIHLACSRLLNSKLYQAVWLVYADPQNALVKEPDPSLAYEAFIGNLSSASLKQA